MKYQKNYGHICNKKLDELIEVINDNKDIYGVNTGICQACCRIEFFKYNFKIFYSLYYCNPNTYIPYIN